MITDDIFIDSDSDLYLYKNSFIYIQLYIVYSKGLSIYYVSIFIDLYSIECILFYSV